MDKHFSLLGTFANGQILAGKASGRLAAALSLTKIQTIIQSGQDFVLLIKFDLDAQQTVPR